MQTTEDNGAEPQPTAEHLEFTDEKGIAELLLCSPRAVREWRRSGVGPPWFRVGARRGLIRYPLAAFRQWVAARGTSERAA